MLFDGEAIRTLTMSYGQIAGSSRVNAAIYRCFEFIPESDAARFVRKFAEQPHDEDQVMHTFRELILGAFLGSRGLTVQSERPIAGKTPDWSVLCGGELQCVIELTDFHTDQSTEEDMTARFAAQQMWAGRSTTPFGNEKGQAACGLAR